MLKYFVESKRRERGKISRETEIEKYYFFFQASTRSSSDTSMSITCQKNVKELSMCFGVVFARGESDTHPERAGDLTHFSEKSN